MSIVTGSVQVAYKTVAQWTAWNGIPLAGQLCYSSDTFYGSTNCPKFKVGNGVDTWANLDYHPDTTGASGIDQLTGDVTAGPGSGSQASTIANDAVTFAKMQNIATDKLLGRDTAGSGDIQEIGLDDTLEFDGVGNIQRAALTGDVTATAGSNATTLATVNANVGSFTNASITVNSKGLITAASSGASSTNTITVLDSFNARISTSSATATVTHRTTTLAANTFVSGDMLRIYAGIYKNAISTDTGYVIQLIQGTTSTHIMSIAGVNVATAMVSRYDFFDGTNFLTCQQNVYIEVQPGVTLGAVVPVNIPFDLTQPIDIVWQTTSANAARVRGYDYGSIELIRP